MTPIDERESTTDAAATGNEADPTTEAAAASDPLSPEEELAAARAEAAENFDRFLRAKADIDNILKRHQRDLAERSRYEGEALARDILQAVDDLERALGHSEGESAGLIDGVNMVLSGLLATLKRHGVERIEAEGKPFDPSEHEAVTMVETAEVEPNTVVAVFRAGYRMRERLLRAAMVSVAKAPAPKD